MRRTALLIAATLSIAGAPAAAHGASEHGAGHGATGDPAATGTHPVAIAKRAFAPARVTALEGDTVDWRNEDFMIHNVSAAAGAIFSGGLGRGERFAHRFSDAGSYPYLCTIHPFMTGQVDVHPALLEAASSSALAGQEVALHGRAPAGPVTIEQQVAGAPGFTPVATLLADSAGRFHGDVRPEATTAYRAVGVRGASPPVTVAVASQLRVALTVRRSGRVTKLRVTARGAGGAAATLQLYSRERFMWRDRRRGRLDAAGRTTFRLRAGLRYHARVVVSGDDDAVLGTSRTVKLPRRAAKASAGGLAPAG